MLRRAFAIWRSDEPILREAAARVDSVIALLHDLLDVLQEPPVDLRQLENLLDRPPALEREAEEEDPLRIRHRQLRAQRVVIDDHILPIADQPKALDLQTRAAPFAAPP